MALLTNINDLFTVDSTGAISFNRIGTSTTTGFTFPALDGGANQILKTNGDGVLSWVDDEDNDVVTKIIGGTNITVSPATGLGDVTVNADLDGTVTGSGTLNKVARWTATGSDIGDGPITFSSSAATATSTFGGAVNATGNITTDGIFKVDSAPDNNILEVDQSGRKMALKTSFASNTTGSFWAFKVSTGATDGAMTDALVLKPLLANFAGSITALDATFTNEVTVNKTNATTPGKITIKGNSGPILQLKSEDTAMADNELIGAIEFYNSDGTANAGVRAKIESRTLVVGGTGNEGNLGFFTATASNVAAVRRLKITPSGGFSFGSTSTAYGTSGQVLTSNGNAPPSWQDNGDGTVTGSGAANRVTYWSSTTNVTSDASFTYNGAGRVNTDESFGVSKDGADTVADGPFFRLTNAAQTIQYLWQLDASNNIDYWYYNGSTWAQTISLLNNGGAIFTGNVGIGVTGPGVQLEVGKSATIGAGSVSTSTTNHENVLKVKGKNNYSDGTTWYGDYGQILLSADSNMTGSAHQFLITNALDNNKFAIVRSTDANTVPVVSSTANGVNSGTADFVIDGDGRVGIGTTSPSQQLELGGIASPALKLTSTSTNGGVIIFNVAGADKGFFGSGYHLGTGSSNDTAMRGESDLVFLSGGNNQRMTILSGGNVGIGTTLPSNLLSLKGLGNNWNTSAAIKLWDSLYNVGWYVGTANNDVAGDYYIRSVTSEAAYPVAADQQFTIKQNGNVGIGTISPTTSLSVKGTSSNGINIIGVGTTATRCYLGLNSANKGYLFIAGSSGENPAVITSQGNSYISTNLGIGRTAPDYKLVVSNSSNEGIEFGPGYTSGANLFQNYNRTNSQYVRADWVASTHRWYQGDTASVEVRMSLTGSGVLTVKNDIVAYGSPSDKRLKENIKPIESALDKVSKLQGVTFDWKESDSILNIKEDIGFIAQDVQKVIPELVRENKDGMLSMRHQGIAPILLEAIKELKAEIEELKSNKCNCNK